MIARLITAIVLIPIVLAAVLCTEEFPLVFLAAIALVIGVGELQDIAGSESNRMPAIGFLTFIAGAVYLVLWPTTTNLRALLYFCIAFVLLGILAAELLTKRPGSRWLLELASLWIAIPLLMVLFLHSVRANRMIELWDFRTPVLMALIPIWIGDSAGMIFGKAFGKRLLAPNISPKKTLVGALANLIGCLVGASVVGIWIGTPWPVWIGCGLAAGILGQAGDLFESALKRSFDKKDSGAILPGHGGLLDRIDAFLFAAPAITLILVLWDPALRAGIGILT